MYCGSNLLTGFAGFFCFSELADIQPNHIFFYNEFVKVFLPKSKTDVYREGNYSKHPHIRTHDFGGQAD